MSIEAPANATEVLDAHIKLTDGNRFLAERTWTADNRVHAVNVRAQLTSRGTYGAPRAYRSWRTEDVERVETGR